MKYLESKVTCCGQITIDILIVDVLFYLYLQTSLPQIFGQVATTIFFGSCCLEGNEIHVVFNKFINPSIKDSERDLRACDRDAEFEITGKLQKKTR